MRIRRETSGTDQHTLAIHDDQRWVPLRPFVAEDASRWPALASSIDDAVKFLADGERARDEAYNLCVAVRDREIVNGLVVAPLQPRSLRCFASWEKHWIDGGRALAKRYHPLARFAITPYEALLGKAFPPLRPGREFYEHPVYYTGNHLSMLTDGDVVAWPRYCKDLDYELEIAAVVCSEVHDASAYQARSSIGGFVVFNDLSARDVQWKEYTGGLFGPVVKTKSFGSVLGAEIVTADAVLERQDNLVGSVTVNGERWADASTQGMRYPFEEMLAWASRGERITPGELLSSGTLPGGSGMEIDRWLSPGDEVTLLIEGVGSVTNRIGPRPDALP